MKRAVLQKISYQIRPVDYIKKNGNAAFYLQVVIDREARRIPLEIEFNPKLFNQEKEVFVSNGNNEDEVTDLNIILNTEKAKANEIVRHYRLAGRTLTHKDFKNEFLNYGSRENFIAWAKRKINDDYIGEIISNQTYKNKKNRILHLENFAGVDLTFSDINTDLITRFDVHLRKKLKLKHNTVVSVLKSIKSFISDAKEAGINLNDPFEKFKIKRYRPGDREALEAEELALLKKLYNSKTLTDFEQEVLRKFLFSCYTGLRISDNNNLDFKHIENDVIRLPTQKGENFGKEVIIPLPKYAISLLDKKKKGNVFRKIDDQSANRTLKVIAGKANIEKRLTFHVSRDTFGTLFIELGGDVATLRELMDHSKVDTTMIYVKMSENRKKKLMQNFDKL